MSDAYLFLQTIWPKVWGIVGAGILLGLDEIVARYSPAVKRRLDGIPEEMRRILEVTLLCGAIFYAGFSAWQDEHTARVKLDADVVDLRAKVHMDSPKAEGPIHSTEPPERMPDGDLLYQNGKAIGSTGRFTYEQSAHMVVFGRVKVQDKIDFSKRVLFRDSVLHCINKSPKEVSFGDFYSVTYFDLRCDVSPSDARLD